MLYYYDWVLYIYTADIVIVMNHLYLASINIF